MDLSKPESAYREAHGLMLAAGRLVAGATLALYATGDEEMADELEKFQRQMNGIEMRLANCEEAVRDGFPPEEVA